MKNENSTETELFRTEKIPKILLKMAPPVMLAQLIQAMYNIVDSFFVGQYSANALTALSVIYPLQLIIIALAVGTGVGVNTYMARQYAQKLPDPNFLGVITSGASLYLVRISDFRSSGRSCGTGILSENDYGLEEIEVLPKSIK